MQRVAKELKISGVVLLPSEVDAHIFCSSVVGGEGHRLADEVTVMFWPVRDHWDI